MQTNFGDELYKYLEIHKKEKTFIASSYFVTGKLKLLGKKRNICAPLIITPITIEINNEGLYHINYNFDENRINDALLNLIKNNYNLDDSFILNIKSLITNQPIGEIDILGIVKKLKEFITIDSEPMAVLPKLVDVKEMRSHQKSETVKLIPAIALGIIEKSKSSRDVLHEINEIKEGHIYNQTLEYFFSRRKAPRNPETNSKPIYVPSNLSEPQLAIIKEVRSNALTVVIGPPGTGKSYTIASLAVDQAYHNKSVLICSKSDQAIDVLQNKIIHDLGIKGLSIRAGKGRSHRSKLRKKIEAISRFRNVKGEDFFIPEKRSEIKFARKRIKEISEEIKKRGYQEIKNSELFLDHNPSFFKKIKRNYVSKKVLKQYPFWELVALLKHYLHQKNSLIKELISMQYQKNVWNLIKNNSTFPQFIKLIKTSDPIVKERLFQDLDFLPLLKCLPIWVTKATDMSSLFPLKNDLFDLVIIDEASQCDIATMIPVLARAKKVVIVGDPKQLRHVSFLSKSVMENTAHQHGLMLDIDVLNYRENSLLDYAIGRLESESMIHFLDEHYRSVPGIIRYSNQKFYFDKLKVMSDLKIHNKESGIHWIYCNGEKQKDGKNLSEADTILKDIKELIQKETELSVKIATTIGILSPFRDQVNYLKKELEKFDIVALKKHQIIAGTPFEFQGEERDFMYISFTIDNTTNTSVFQYLDREDVFNVSITRAKQKQFLYYSFEPKNFKNSYLLIEYFSETSIPRQLGNHHSTYVDPFAEQVFEELIQLGINKNDILINYPLAGYVIDIILTYNQKTICIDLVGYPGELEKTFSIEQYKTLFRTNIPIITIPYAYWLFNKEACISHIQKKVSVIK